MSKIENLLSTMVQLRDPEKGCPWDVKQTHDSLARYCLEEAYEVVSSLIRNDDKNMKEELGDLLLQVIFHCQIAAERDAFTFEDVVVALNEKLVRRHPHVFGPENGTKPVTANTAEDVLSIWEQVKDKEKAESVEVADVSDFDVRVDTPFPAAMMSVEIQKKAAKLGFKWRNIDALLEKAFEELSEVKEVAHDEDISNLEEELGDVLFVTTNIGMFKGVDPEVALLKANEKFLHRFAEIGKICQKESLEFQSLSDSDKMNLWNRAKMNIRKAS